MKSLSSALYKVNPWYKSGTSLQDANVLNIGNIVSLTLASNEVFALFIDSSLFVKLAQRKPPLPSTLK
jgi:hypothetical protein